MTLKPLSFQLLKYESEYESGQTLEFLQKFGAYGKWTHTYSYTKVCGKQTHSQLTVWLKTNKRFF